MIPIAYPFFLEIFKRGKSEPSPPEEFKKYQEMIPALKSFPIEYLVPSWIRSEWMIVMLDTYNFNTEIDTTTHSLGW